LVSWLGISHVPIPGIRIVCETASTFAIDTYQRVCDIDDMVTLDVGTLLQYQKLKYTHLVDGIARLSEKTETKKNTDASDIQVTRSTTLKRRKATFFYSYEDEIPDLAACYFDHEDIQYYFNTDLEVGKPLDPFTFDELQVDLTSVVQPNRRLSVLRVWDIYE
jgi:hypothetical protein